MEASASLLNGHYRIPPMIIQPYVENAIHHGIKHRGDKSGLIIIKASMEDQQLVFDIDDNGVGRQRAFLIKQQQRTTHESKGTQLTQRRLDLYRIGLQMIDKTDEEGNATGTTIHLIIPNP